MKVTNINAGYLLGQSQFRVVFQFEDGSTSSINLSEEMATKLAIGLLRRPPLPEGEIDPTAVFETGSWDYWYDDFGDLTVVSEIETGSPTPTQIGLQVSSLEIDDFAKFLNRMIQDRPPKMQPQ